jgi:hypothetical protein
MDTIAEAMRANDGKITHERILEWLFGQIVEPGPGMTMRVFVGTRLSEPSNRLEAIVEVGKEKSPKGVKGELTI